MDRRQVQTLSRPGAVGRVPRQTHDVIAKPESHSEPETSYWTLISRYILWPFVQGVMLGLGQYGTRYFLAYVVRRKEPVLPAIAYDWRDNAEQGRV